jgi:hypothetical protein
MLFWCVLRKCGQNGVACQVHPPTNAQAAPTHLRLAGLAHILTFAMNLSTANLICLLIANRILLYRFSFNYFVVASRSLS